MQLHDRTAVGRRSLNGQSLQSDGVDLAHGELLPYLGQIDNGTSVGLLENGVVPAEFEQLRLLTALPLGDGLSLQFEEAVESHLWDWRNTLPQQMKGLSTGG